MDLLLMGALRPDPTWIGLDERTVLIVDPEGAVRVVGSGNGLVARRAPSVRARPPQVGRALEASDCGLTYLPRAVAQHGLPPILAIAGRVSILAGTLLAWIVWIRYQCLGSAASTKPEVLTEV